MKTTLFVMTMYTVANKPTSFKMMNLSPLCPDNRHLPKFLTFDYEDWFHLLYAMENSQFCRWGDLESRLDYGADLILQTSELLGAKITVFTLGWIAKIRPDLVKRLADEEMEIACHSMSHQSFRGQGHDFLRREITDSKKLLEDVISQKVAGFRAPAFTITLDNEAALNEIIEAGYIYDSSISLVRRLNDGLNSQTRLRAPFRVKFRDESLIEFPLVPDNRYFNSLLTGGGYFRLLPKFISDKIIKSNATEYYMTYFHPRDFDVLQPKLKHLPFYNRFRAYYGINKSLDKISAYQSMRLSGTISSWLNHAIK